MKVPISWLKDYVDMDLPLLDLAHKMTMIGLEVEEILLVGLPRPVEHEHEFKIEGISWSPERIVVAQIDEVMPHPHADRLVLCRLQDGRQEHIVLTGAPNLFPYKGQGPLAQPLKVAYAMEGAQIYDGHQVGQVLTTLKRAKIRGVDSYSMVCSEKELGISEDHEGVIILDQDAPTGQPLVDYMGDAVFEVKLEPNMIRNACMIGIAREIAALTGKTLRQPARTLPTDGPSVVGQVGIEIKDPELNPRFVLGLVRGVKPQPSPYWVQLRLRLAGMRPINSVVDATNYVMLETNEPLHAFDYDLLVKRVNGKVPKIITRTAMPGEKLKTLDGVERALDDFTVLVTDTVGGLSIAGVMGGEESEVRETTANVLLEGATWNFINIRRTVAAQQLNSEAAYRFARGLHPALAPQGVQLGLERIAAWSGGQIAVDLVDAYPQPRHDPVVRITPLDVHMKLGIDLSTKEIAGLLERLEFKCRLEGDEVVAQTPPHRVDIGEGLTGVADLTEEIARMFGYENIPATRLGDPLPPQRRNPNYEGEELLRDLLARLGLQEVITHRLTSVERELRALPLSARRDDVPYVRIQNPITPDRNVMRRSLLASVLEIIERNSRLSERLAMFEIGQVFLPVHGELLPNEQNRLVIALTGRRHLQTWDRQASQNYDFYDLKGLLDALLDALHLPGARYEPAEHPSFHPGKCAHLSLGGKLLGVLGELHPLVKERYDLGSAPVLAAELDVSALIALLPDRYATRSVPAYPPVLEDIAVVVDETMPAERIEDVIRQAGGELLTGIHLFDIYRGEQIGENKKSMAYSLTYQAFDRTLTDQEAAQIRSRVIHRLEKELGGKVRTA